MQATLEQRALKLSIVMTLVVSSLGVTVGLLAGSQSILFDGVFSTIDAAMSGLALLVARLAVREASQRFQHGYWHLEPLVAALNGSILMLLCFYAFLTALLDLREGGRELAFDLAIAYAVVVAIACFVMTVYQRRINRTADSEFVRIDMQGWLMAREGLLTYYSHVAKAGRGHYIEIHIVTTPDFAAERGVAVMDEIREQIAVRLSPPPERRWFTVAFTADERWA